MEKQKTGKGKKILIGIGVLVILGAIGKLSDGGESKSTTATTQTYSQATTATSQATPTPQATKATVIANVKDIAEKSEADVEKILGKPTSKENAKWRYYGTDKYIENCSKLKYSKGLEILFVENKAARITYTPDTPLDFKPSTNLALLGYNTTDNSATASNDLSSAWKNLEGSYSAQIFKNGNKVDYIYIITKETYR